MAKASSTQFSPHQAEGGKLISCSEISFLFVSLLFVAKESLVLRRAPICCFDYRDGVHIWTDSEAFSCYTTLNYSCCCEVTTLFHFQEVFLSHFSSYENQPSVMSLRLVSTPSAMVLAPPCFCPFPNTQVEGKIDHQFLSRGCKKVKHAGG